MNYINISKEDVCNGDGLRVVLWLSGCSHKCYNCQNSQTWNPEGGIKYDENAKNEIFNELQREYISGITLSGGDPLYENNLKDVLDLIQQIRVSFPGKTVWIYSGYTWENIWNDEAQGSLRQQILQLCDIFVDGRYVEELRDLTIPWSGSSNQRVINVQDTLKKGEVVLWNS